jgi:LptD protein
VIRRIALGLLLILPATVTSQIPRLPGARPGTPQPQRQQRDTLSDSTRVKWPAPDTVMQRLLSKQGYSITRYLGDTAYFDANKRVLDLLAATKRPAVVDRDSQTVVSDSGIYYTESIRHGVAGGHYVLTPPPGSGQADIKGKGRVDFDMAERSVRVTRARLPVNNGEMWYLDVDLAKVVQDTANGKSPTAYIRGGSLTSCDDSIPDYHFEYRDAKRASNNTLVARPAILYIKDIPVLWLPFIFTDTRSGRHSGLLPPQFGVGDIVRNSPTYRRNVEHLGYYWALNDYMDFGTWLDWRSSAGSTAGDPGWIRVNGDWDYKWIDRFLSGRIGSSFTKYGSGLSNTAVSWSHQQDFSHDSHLTTNVNYVTSTVLQRENTFNSYTALATIYSSVNYQTKFGPTSVSLGATRKQYPGRQQVDQTFPTISLTSTPIGIGKVFSWTPGFSFNRSDVLNMDQPGIGAFTYRVDPVTGVRDSVLSKSRGSSTASMTFDSPMEIFGWNFRNSFRVNQQRNNFPQNFPIYDVNTGAITDQRVFAATYRTDVDWTPDFTLPAFAHNRFNLTPSVSLGNVDPGPFWVASERTNGRYVHQSKRITGGVSASPSLFGFFPGFGPFTRIRHAITPQVSFNWAPAGEVSDEYLIAIGRTRKGYLGNLEQRSISFGLNQNFQAKVRSKNDSNPEGGQKVDLLSINSTPLSYDFVRAAEFARTHGHRGMAGLTTETWGYTLRSELLPGFDFSSNYSLFSGSTLSDTAKFKPFLTSISASFSISRDQNPRATFAKLFGKVVPDSQKAVARADSSRAQQGASQPVAGSVRGVERLIIPSSQGWRASFSFTRSSPRPPTCGDVPCGAGNNVIDYDPRVRCQQTFGANPLLLDACLAQTQTQATAETPVTSLTIGGPVYRIPATTSLNSDVSFNLTPKWVAKWTTTYDFERHQFAQHNVQLQRELHDWRAFFGFTQSANGNFSFNFTIGLKAEPDLKFDYNRNTIRSGATF